MEWTMFDSNYDFKSEIRNSGYADMLNDKDRNTKYYHALKKVIRKMQKENKRVHVLDIGCGSGILSMMALKLGADKVTACESFQPMYECAKSVLRRNRMLTDRIDLLNCNSADLKIGVNMHEKANILVSEIFDTELIGEGVLPTFRHAVTELLTPTATVIPHKAQIYVQLIDSDFLHRHSWLTPTAKYFPALPPSFRDCRGYSALFDIHASALSNYAHSVVTAPILIEEIDLTDTAADIRSNVRSHCSVPHGDGRSDRCGFVLWWELSLTADSDCRISTAPKWALARHSEFRWRDHWLQSVCSAPIDRSRDTIDFSVCRDAYSFWIEPHCGEAPVQKPFCICGLHLHIGRNRLYQLNDAEYQNDVDYVTEFAVRSGVTQAVVISDFSYLSVSLPRAGVATQTVIDNESVRRLMQQLIDFNGNGTDWGVLSSLEGFSVVDSDVVGIFGDPFFIYANLPWENVHFWYAAQHLRKRHRVGTRCLILPRKMRINAMLVKFEHLHKIIEPVGFVRGFDLSPFDEMVHGGGDCDRLSFESRFLWEYECYARSEVGEMITIDMTASVEEMCRDGITELKGSHNFHSVNWKDINGLVLWVVWEIGEDVWMDCSLQSVDSGDGKITWKAVTKQAIHFLTRSRIQNLNEIEFKCSFDIRSSDFRFSAAI